MLTLNDGRSELWQWDTGRKLSVDAECSQVHFSNKFFGRSIDVDVVDGVAIIPDILLQTDNDLMAWGFAGSSENGYTKISKIFKVNRRNKPSDYVFTPHDQTTLKEILDRLEDVENKPDGGITSDSITNALGYVPVDSSKAKIAFYFTDREPVPGASMQMQTDTVYDLYDRLYPDFESGKKMHNDLTDNNNNAVLREYVFSMGEYNEAGNRGVLDTDIKKPVVLVMSGIHGTEKAAVMSTYKFFKDFMSRKNIPANIPEDAIFKVVPVVNPYGFDRLQDTNEGGVNLNRNFDYNWEPATDAGANYGTSAASEAETQAIVKWLKENKDAILLMDMHGSGNKTNNADKFKEVTNFVGLNNNQIVKQAKKTALRGVGRVIPYWRNVIKYKPDTIYAYSSFVNAGGGCVYYAADSLGIPAFALELSRMQNGAKDWMEPETVSAGAEAIGNVLIEFVEDNKIPKLSSLTNVAEVGA